MSFQSQHRQYSRGGSAIRTPKKHCYGCAGLTRWNRQMLLSLKEHGVQAVRTLGNTQRNTRECSRQTGRGTARKHLQALAMPWLRNGDDAMDDLEKHLIRSMSPPDRCAVWMMLKYGRLDENWKKILSDGFRECFRALDNDGVLVFKWSEVQIPLREILPLSPYPPLFGHRSGKNMNTHWLCFMKPKEK